ncbi:MAG: aspartate aminotransferase family protein [Bacillota bacterium]|nr:aspartate aminotransferase family protein [Bacillota bacterium]
MPHKKLIGLDQALQLNQKEIRTLYKRYLNPGFATMLSLLNFDKKFVRAEGVCVWDEAGKCYLDFLGGYGALNFGHNHPHINAALQQVSCLPNLLQASLGPLSAVLAHNLAQITPENLEHTFFCNSGAEAVEGALKLAKAATRKKRIVYCEGSFHGKTLGALSVTGRSKYQVPFKPLIPGCEQVAFGDPSALEEKLREGDVAAFILEPIQGEGGVRVPHQGYLSEVRQLCKEYNCLLILDEIQTGLGRTGTIFACELEGVVPDIMCTGKSLGGGVMPLAAFTTTESIWDQAYGGFEKCLLHTSTFGGNTRAMAAGIVALQVLLEEKLAAQADEKGAYFLQKLRYLQEKHPSFIKEVRGRGLLIGVEFNQLTQGVWNKLTGGKLNKYAEEYLAALVAAELLNKYQIITAYTLNNPNVIRFEPPLVVSRQQLDQVLSALEEIFETYQSIWRFVLTGSKYLLSSFKPSS